MSQTFQFSRTKVQSIMPAVAGFIIFGNGLLQYNQNSTLSIASLIVGGLCVVMGWWGNATPFIIKENDALYINNNIFSKHTISISSLASVEIKDDRIILHHKNKSSVTAYLSFLDSADRPKAIESLKELLPKS